MVDVINLETNAFETVELDRACCASTATSIPQRARPDLHGRTGPRHASLRRWARTGRTTTSWSPSRGCISQDLLHQPDPRDSWSCLSEKLDMPVDLEFAQRRRGFLPGAVPGAELLRGRRAGGDPPRPASRSNSCSPPTATSPTAASRTSPTSSTSIRRRYANLADLRETEGRGAGAWAGSTSCCPNASSSSWVRALGQSRRHQAGRERDLLRHQQHRRAARDRAAEGQLPPELSFGTHFFQDLVEAEIRYIPLYPDDPGDRLQRGILAPLRNILCRRSFPSSPIWRTSCA